MNIDLDTLLLLDTIERRGSFAAAADALHRVPSALTHALRRAEAALGFPLYVREGRRAVLTAAGRSLLDGGRPLLDAAAGLERRARQVAKGWESELRIAVDALIPIERLFPLVAQFHADGHETELRLSAEVLAGCWDALLSGRADLAIGAPGDTPPGGGLATRPMGAIDFIFAIAPHHPLAASPEPLAAAEIRRHRAVVLADTSLPVSTRREAPSPCLSCADRACIAACPAQALADGTLDLDRCVAYRQQAESRCRDTCLARESCPVAAEHRYDADQLRHSYSRSLAMLRNG